MKGRPFLMPKNRSLFLNWREGLRQLVRISAGPSGSQSACGAGEPKNQLVSEQKKQGVRFA